MYKIRRFYKVRNKVFIGDKIISFKRGRITQYKIIDNYVTYIKGMVYIMPECGTNSVVNIKGYRIVNIWVFDDEIMFNVYSGRKLVVVDRPTCVIL